MPQETLTPKGLRAISLVVRTGCTWLEAAEHVNLAQKTLQDMRKTSVFCAALDVARAEYEAEVWAKLRAAAGAAADTLIHVTTDSDEKGAVRVQAANSVLDRSRFRAGDQLEGAQPIVPYATRGELIEALSGIPADVLAEVLAKVTAR